jgi:hypothetical protein
MFLREEKSRHLFELSFLSDLFDPLQPKVLGGFHSGSQIRSLSIFEQQNIVFPTGGCLPVCWSDVRQSLNDSIHEMPETHVCTGVILS